MVKRISISKIALSAFVFTMLCLLPSAATAQTPGEPQQGAINTSRSNLKNTNRTGTTRFDPLVLDLKKASGEKMLTRQIADLDNDGKISEAESAFNFDVLPAGDYELKVSSQESTGEVDADAARGVNVNNPKNLGRLTMTLTGAVGGTLTHELKADLGSQLGSEVARAGKPKFKNITFKADGKGTVKGVLRHEAATNGIKNMR